MPTAEKQALINELTDKLNRSKVTILVQAQGLKVSDMTDLRRKITGAGHDFQVIKNTLMIKALKAAQFTGLDDLFQGPTAVAFGYHNEPGLAKTVTEYVRTSKVVTIKSGILGRRKLSTKEVEALSKAPTTKEAQAQVLGAVVGPLTGTGNVIAGPLQNFVYLLQAQIDKLGGVDAPEPAETPS